MRREREKWLGHKLIMMAVSGLPVVVCLTDRPTRTTSVVFVIQIEGVWNSFPFNKLPNSLCVLFMIGAIHKIMLDTILCGIVCVCIG